MTDKELYLKKRIADAEANAELYRKKGDSDMAKFYMNAKQGFEKRLKKGEGNNVKL